MRAVGSQKRLSFGGPSGRWVRSGLVYGGLDLISLVDHVLGDCPAGTGANNAVDEFADGESDGLQLADEVAGVGHVHRPFIFRVRAPSNEVARSGALRLPRSTARLDRRGAKATHTETARPGQIVWHREGAGLADFAIRAERAGPDCRR